MDAKNQNHEPKANFDMGEYADLFKPFEPSPNPDLPTGVAPKEDVRSVEGKAKEGGWESAECERTMTVFLNSVIDLALHLRAHHGQTGDIGEICVRGILNCHPWADHNRMMSLAQMIADELKKRGLNLFS